MYRIDNGTEKTFIQKPDYIQKDFRIADLFGEEVIRNTYKRAKAEWKKNRIYGAELPMVFNYKCWYQYSEPRSKLGDKYGKLYAELWKEFDNWILDNWKGEVWGII